MQPKDWQEGYQGKMPCTAHAFHMNQVYNLAQQIQFVMLTVVAFAWLFVSCLSVKSQCLAEPQDLIPLFHWPANWYCNFHSKMFNIVHPTILGYSLHMAKP